MTNSCSESNFGKPNHALNQTVGPYVYLKNGSIRNIIQGKSTSNSTSAEKLTASIWSWSSPVNLLRRESHQYGIFGKNVEKFSY